MRAYIFWHRPHASVGASQYEQALLNFQRSLAGRSPGFRDGASYRVPEMPWLGGQRGYEDWYLVDGTWALDPLNEFAVSGQMQAPHTAVAQAMEAGYGGLYGLIWGASDLAERRLETWLTRPRGIDWRPALEPLKGRQGIACWRRQMVLGPAPEFVVVSPFGQKIDPPKDWVALAMPSVRLT